MFNHLKNLFGTHRQVIMNQKQIKINPRIKKIALRPQIKQWLPKNLSAVYSPAI